VLTGGLGLIEHPQRALAHLGRVLLVHRVPSLLQERNETQADSTVTWTLQEVPGGTMVTLRHEGFDPSDPASRMYRTLSERGWPGTMGRLGRCIASAPTGDDQPPHCLVTDVSA
ncbi:SRPBCC family protein, partial [Mycobacteroides abscessus]|uniref:SRPBCC family protein n=1 Tax=Mycobacteroides abscessus TaxID=36809 RepID=UPI0021054B81